MSVRRTPRALILPGLLAPALFGCGDISGSVPANRTVAAGEAELAASRRTAIVRAAERVAPAVVSVNVLRRETVQPSSLWESFVAPHGEREMAGLGSGFIIREDGLVLTNEHVVRGADQVIVTLADGREFQAEVVGTDEVNDLALARIPGPSKLRSPLSATPTAS